MEIIMENWLSVGTAVFLIIMMLYGHYRGFIRQIVTVAAMVAAIIITNLLIPQVESTLQQNKTAHNVIQNMLISSVIPEDSGDGEEEPSMQRSYIEGLKLPEKVKRDLLTNNNSEVYELLGVDRFADYVGAYLSNTILNSAAYIIVFLVTFLGIHLIMKWLDLIAKLPILSGLNQIAGAGLGLAQGLLIIWIGCLVLTVFAGTTGGAAFTEQIEKSTWLSFLYNHNFLIHIAMGIFQGRV